ncbi:hypothetical protein KFL_016510010, partial [Klebsormidium nitens]
MADVVLFKGIIAGERVYLVVWGDDILLAAREADRIAKVKAHFSQKSTGAIWGRHLLPWARVDARQRGAHPEVDAEEADEEAGRTLRTGRHAGAKRSSWNGGQGDGGR